MAKKTNKQMEPIADPLREKEAIIAAAYELSDSTMEINIPVEQLPLPYSVIAKENVPGMLGMIAGLSFKLYLKYHTETDQDLKQIATFIKTYDVLSHLSHGSDEADLSVTWIMFLLKMAYPQIKGETVLEDIGVFFYAVLTKKISKCNPVYFFNLALRLMDHLTELPYNISEFVKMYSRHRQNTIQFGKAKDWSVVQPAYEDYVKGRDQGNRYVFGSVFNAGTGSMCDNSRKLEYLLKSKQGMWDQPEYNARYRRTETEKEVFRKIYKRWEKNFRLAYDRERAGYEAQIVAFMEKSFWKKTAREERLQSIISQIPPSSNNIDPQALSQLDTFIRNISLS